MLPRNDDFGDMDRYADAEELFEVGSVGEGGSFSDDGRDDVSVSSMLPGLRSPLSMILEEDGDVDGLSLLE